MEWERFNYYASHVKYLRSSLVVYLHKTRHDMDFIRAYAQTHILLPNLLTLSTGSPAGDEFAGNLLDWLEVLISPSLQKLDISHSQNRDSYSPAVVDRYYQLVQRATKNCRELRSLSYNYGGAPATHSPTFLEGHTVLLPEIEHVRCRFAVFCPEVLAWLGAMQSLRKLEFSQLDGFHSAFNGLSLSEQPHAFSKLDHLVLVDSWVGPTIQLFQSPLVRNLVRLDLESATSQGWLSDATLTICQKLPTSCPQLRELSLGFPPNQSLINSLFALRQVNLRSLSVPRANRKILGGPRVVRDLLQLWPLLETLDLPAYDASFEDLGHIIPYSPQLSVLRLAIEMNIPFGISNTRFASVVQPTVKQGHLTLVSSYEHPDQSHELPELGELARCDWHPNSVWEELMTREHL
ncbi:hypothetical protein RhiJN_18580 [Ceratobasidium sp. AG-Ba]|nr:hypothetical protein RhiJN_18580 [Ceratobasidium sp. AG-Ba]